LFQKSLTFINFTLIDVRKQNYMLADSVVVYCSHSIRKSIFINCSIFHTSTSNMVNEDLAQIKSQVYGIMLRTRNYLYAGFDVYATSKLSIRLEWVPNAFKIKLCLICCDKQGTNVNSYLKLNLKWLHTVLKNKDVPNHNITKLLFCKTGMDIRCNLGLLLSTSQCQTRESTEINYGSILLLFFLNF